MKRYLIATLALFIFIVIWEMFIHSFLLAGIYEATATVWRDFAVMKKQLPLELAFQLILSAWTTFIFTRFYSDGGINNGLQFGFLMGVFGGILTATWYLWLPVPAVLGLLWFINGVIEGTLGGLIIGSLYR